MSAEAKLKSMGYEITAAEMGQGKIEPAVRTGNLVFTSGNVSRWGDQSYIGKVGKDLTTEQGYAAARASALGCLSALKAVVGNLDKVTRVVKVLGMVNAAEGFSDTPNVIHGCTDLLNEVFGPTGRHARSAVGLYQLPGNYAVEIEIIFEVRD
ncbi:MAG: RidA family protein [Chloroflexi bacterium]|nr:RidA family protein [Chloroflexota bacterium]